MNLSKMIDLANGSGGTLYVMALLLLVALTVIIERSRHLLHTQRAGEDLMRLLRDDPQLRSPAAQGQLERHAGQPQARMIGAMNREDRLVSRETAAGHLEEALMHEAPLLDRSLWVLDTVITLAPLLGLFGTIIGMFRAFSVLDDVQNGASQVTGGIAEALIATACGLFIAMLGLLFFNWLSTRVRVIVHQLETIKVMLLNRREALDTTSGPRLKAA
ncbi:MAG: MotA/TolQ/ExbB proton channel family protein [Desulfovibrionaceae bacterium]|jgi:biopolymer transport protein ExbB|nr:MotA/TolQ/ExbB proton channel family protein [Desulfovibrionaceae bacterium]